MQFYNFSSQRRTPFSPIFEIVLFEDFIELDFFNIKSEILSKETKIISNTIYESDWGTGLGKDSLTSRSPTYNLLEWEICKPLKLEIKKSHDTILDKLNLPSKNIYCQCWANVLRKGEKIKPHRHSHDEWTYLSGHICVDVNDTKTYYVHPYSREPFGSPNVNNKITIFPSWMEHYTDRFLGEGERITIAFDLYDEDGFNKKIVDDMKDHWILL